MNDYRSFNRFPYSYWQFSSAAVSHHRSLHQTPR